MPSLRPIVTKLRAELRNGIEELERARIDTVAENVRRVPVNSKSSKEKKMDSFLDEVNKTKISHEIHFSYRAVRGPDLDYILRFFITFYAPQRATRSSIAPRGAKFGATGVETPPHADHLLLARVDRKCPRDKEVEMGGTSLMFPVLIMLVKQQIQQVSLGWPLLQPPQQQTPPPQSHQHQSPIFTPPPQLGPSQPFHMQQPASNILISQNIRPVPQFAQNQVPIINHVNNMLPPLPAPTVQSTFNQQLLSSWTTQMPQQPRTFNFPNQVDQSLQRPPTQSSQPFIGAFTKPSIGQPLLPKLPEKPRPGRSNAEVVNKLIAMKEQIEKGLHPTIKPGIKNDRIKSSTKENTKLEPFVDVKLENPNPLSEPDTVFPSTPIPVSSNSQTARDSNHDKIFRTPRTKSVDSPSDRDRRFTLRTGSFPSPIASDYYSNPELSRSDLDRNVFEHRTSRSRSPKHDLRDYREYSRSPASTRHYLKPMSEYDEKYCSRDALPEYRDKDYPRPQVFEHPADYYSYPPERYNEKYDERGHNKDYLRDPMLRRSRSPPLYHYSRRMDESGNGWYGNGLYGREYQRQGIYHESPRDDRYEHREREFSMRDVDRGYPEREYSKIMEYDYGMNKKRWH
ncbi:1082_t:CDS:2 [Paraglomus brasilianum]|uniref:1082_t:CDS:1 n=1 Tax=Paraglomus brasilianum TaxID=144538 RepID=A0A9N9GG25_9GLOM|nr:1082_t:CDS:2 [Paraglomus brasilianum]